VNDRLLHDYGLFRFNPSEVAGVPLEDALGSRSFCASSNSYPLRGISCVVVACNTFLGLTAENACLLELVLRLMTVGSVLVSAVAVYTAIHTHGRQINAQIFLAYSDRLQSIRRSMRDDLLVTRKRIWDHIHGHEIPPGAIETLHLIFELYALREQRYLNTNTWSVWYRDIERFLNAPLIREGAAQLRSEFEGHPDFIEWVARCQGTKRPPGE
jgi:hypothetical protein